MPEEWNPIRLEAVIVIEEAAKKIHEKLLSIHKRMVDNDLASIESMWAQVHTTRLSSIAKVIEKTYDEIDDQVLAKRMGTKSRIELDRDRNKPAKKSPKKAKTKSTKASRE
jgi:hypothetical protein